MRELSAIAIALTLVVALVWCVLLCALPVVVATVEADLHSLAVLGWLGSLAVVCIAMLMLIHLHPMFFLGGGAFYGWWRSG